MKRPLGLAAENLGGMRRGLKGRLGHTDDRHAVLGPDVGTQARPAGGIQIDIAINHDHRKRAGSRDDSTQRWQLAAEELSRPIRCPRGNHRGPGPGHPGEGPLVRSHHSRPGLRLAQVMDVDRYEQAAIARGLLHHPMRA